MIKKYLSLISFKNREVFLLFLLLTLVLWFIIQMTRTYTYSSYVTLKIKETPNHIAIDTDEIKIPVEIQANGFKLWMYNITKDDVEINYEVLKKQSSDLMLNTGDLKLKLQEQEDFNAENLKFLSEYFYVSYYEKETKRVPIRSNIAYNFADGYNTLDSISFTPDSVIVSGSSTDLKGIDQIFTISIFFDQINQELSGTVGLVLPNTALTLSEEKVNYLLQVEKFSENFVMAEIEMINVPDNVSLNIFPTEVKISFLVSLKSYEAIDKNDFKVVCDFENRFEEEAVIIPELIQKPKVIKNVKMHSTKVDYLLVQIP